METLKHGQNAGRRIEERKEAEDAGGGIIKPQGVPGYVGRDFDRVVYRITYKEFLQHLTTAKSIAGYGRQFAEEEWCKLVKEKWTEWETGKPEQEKNAELQHALSQIHGFPGFDAEEYWASFSKPANEKYSEDGLHDATGLKLPKYEGKFEHVALKLGYKEFLKRLDHLNGPVIDRSKADTAWKDFIQLKWDEWKTDLPSDQKEKILTEAFEQITNGTKGFYRDKMDIYWQQKAKSLGVAQKPISKEVEMRESSI